MAVQRIHLVSLWPLALFVFALVAIGCAAELPLPTSGPVPMTALRRIPYPPPTARTEIVPPRPDPRAVWIDGQWDFLLRRWQWQEGGWVLPPASAYFTPWLTVRRADGELFFARPAWRGARGEPVAPPMRLSPVTRAR